MSLSNVTELVEDAIKEYMETQPYDVYCSVCSKQLERKTTVDKDGDLIVAVEPCEHCLEEARKETRDEEEGN